MHEITGYEHEYESDHAAQHTPLSDLDREYDVQREAILLKFCKTAQPQKSDRVELMSIPEKNKIKKSLFT